MRLSSATEVAQPKLLATEVAETDDTITNQASENAATEVAATEVADMNLQASIRKHSRIHSKFCRRIPLQPKLPHSATEVAM